MSPAYDAPPRRNQTGPEDVTGLLVLLACAVLAFCWYVAVSRLHLRNSQCLEIFMDLAILFFGGGLVVAQLVGRRQKREANWPHPPVFVSGAKDSEVVNDAGQNEATLLGYDVHGQPWLWTDAVRMKHGVIVGGTGAGKSTFLENIISQDLNRRFGDRKMPMIIFDGKGEREFLDRLLPHIEAAGRLQDLRVLDPTHPSESARYNPFYALDDAYQEHVNFIFRSFGLREDFFKGHQEAYLSDLVRILQYTGKLFNVYDVLVMALDENVLQEQIGIATARLKELPDISMQKRLNFEMSVRMLQRSLSDRERVEKIQGLLNELLSFLEDELSVVTGSYQDLLTLDDVFEKDLILFVSLNTNRNQRAVEALGKILLQNIQLMVGKRYTHLSGLEYLQLVGRLRGMGERLLEGKARWLLHLLGLEHAQYSPMENYSKGMRQRVLIAAAVLHDPNLIVFDEPLSGLDAVSALLFKDLLTLLAREGKAILYISHVLEVVERVCGRVIVLSRGKVVADAAPRELPSFWFLGVYECVLHGRSAAEFAGLMAKRGIWATGAALVSAAIVYPLAWIRMRRMAVEGAAALKGKPAPRRDAWMERLISLPARRAVTRFIGQTISRNSRYQVYLAMYCGVGLALAIACAVTFAGCGASLRPMLSPYGLHAVAPLLLFWVIAGLRMAFQLPLNLPARWIFRVSGADRDTCRSAARVWASACAFAVLCAVMAVLSAAGFGERSLLVQAVCGVCILTTMLDVLLFPDEGIPFAQPRSPGKTSLPLMLTLFVGIFPTYLFGMTWIELAIEQKLARLVYPVAFAVAVHWLSESLARRSHAKLEDGDEIEGEFQLLGLSAD